MNDNRTNGKPKAEKTTPNLGGSVSDLIHDLTQLAELQAQLLISNGRNFLGRILRPAIVMLLATVLALSTLPVAMMAGAYGLVEIGWSRWAAFAAVSASALLLGLIAISFAWRKLITALDAFDDSRKEFVENVRWFKHAVRRDKDESTRDSWPNPR